MTNDRFAMTNCCLALGLRILANARLSSNVGAEVLVCSFEMASRNACLARCAQKSSQKSTRPRGAKDAVTFPGAIGRNNACVRADAQQVALGGRKRLPRVGECIVADGRPPCQPQPLRGLSRPKRG